MPQAPLRFYRAVDPRTWSSWRPKAIGYRLAIAGALLLGLSLAVMPCPAAMAAPAPAALSEPQSNGAPPDLSQPGLDAAAATLETATGAIRKGLKQTQREIGKTEARSAAIEHGRDRAVTKLEGLLERAETAEAVEDLSDTDRLTLRRLSQP